MPVAVAVHMAHAGNHDHIATLKTDTGSIVPRSIVAEQAASGTSWMTRGQDGRSASIRPLRSCPQCNIAPYITTKPDDSTLDNLDNLPRF